MDASIYRLRLRDLLTLCVLSLLLLGVLMVQSASTKLTGDTAAWEWSKEGLKHIAMATVAFLTFLIIGHLDYRRLVRDTRVSLKNPIVWFYGLTVLMLAATLVPGIGHSVKGARRWLVFGPIQLQTSELAKWVAVLLIAWLLAYHKVVRTRFKNFALLCFAIAIPLLLVVIQDFGTAALISVTALAMLIAGRAKLWHLAVLLGPGITAAVGFVALEPYRVRRLTTFLDPFKDPRGDGFQAVQSLLSYSSGGLYGRGLGNGIQKLGYLPEDTTDFIFAIICEELGLFGAMLTIILFLGLAFVAWQTVTGTKDTQLDGSELTRQPDGFARLLAFGIGMMICLQAMINMAVATVSVPTKGLSLPLVSAGGSGLVITCAALGVMYSVVRIHETQAAPTPDPELSTAAPEENPDPLPMVAGIASA